MSRDTSPKSDMLRAMREEQTARLEKVAKAPAKVAASEAPAPGKGKKRPKAK